LQVELKGGRIDWRAIVESRSGRGEERIVTCALQKRLAVKEKAVETGIQPELLRQVASFDK
jgi:hypothetical protein